MSDHGSSMVGDLSWERHGSGKAPRKPYDGSQAPDLVDALAAANARIADLEQRTQHAEWERDTWKETAGTLTDQRNERNDVIAALTTRLAASEARVAELTAALREIICDLYEDGPRADRMDKAVKRARAILVAAAAPPV